jgi:hypothetical protein
VPGRLLYYAVNGVLIAAMNHLKQIQENIEQHRFFVELDDKLRSLVDADEIALTAATCMGRYLKAARCGYADVSDNGEEFNLAGNYVDGVADITGRYRSADFGADFLRLSHERASPGSSPT